MLNRSDLFVRMTAGVLSQPLWLLWFDADDGYDNRAQTLLVGEVDSGDLDARIHAKQSRRRERHGRKGIFAEATGFSNMIVGAVVFRERG